MVWRTLALSSATALLVLAACTRTSASASCDGCERAYEACIAKDARGACPCRNEMCLCQRACVSRCELERCG
jgi:hypothetical protein